MKVYKADVLVDGSGKEPQKKMDIFVEGGKILEVVPANSKEYPQDAIVYENPGKTVLPGLIDVHAHLMFGESRSYEDVVYNDSDALMMMRGPRNCMKHLRAGVTTLRDAGAVNNVTFEIKKAAEKGYFHAPRLLVSGRPLTITGGHFWWCNQEADGVDGVRKAVRQLLKDGADFLKVMASGGGTAGTDSTRASFTVEELKAAMEIIHDAGKKATAHCIAAESVKRAAEAGLDQIEHFNFIHPDGSRVFDPEVAEMIVRKGIFLSPTIQTGYRLIERLENKACDKGLSDSEQKNLDEAKYKLDTKLSFVKRFHEMGAKIVYGTDAIREFGDYAIGLELLQRAGMSPKELVLSATSLAAEAIGMQDKVGVVEPGKMADLVYLDANPLDDVKAFDQVSAVILGGKLLVDKRAELLPGMPKFDDGTLAVMPL